MADWTDQDPNSLLPGQPWTSAKALAAFENPVAIAEGAPDAPRIVSPALVAPVAGDDFILWRQDAAVSVNVDTFPDVGLHRYFSASSHVGFLCLVPGSIRCTFDHRVDAAGTTSSVRIIKNGTQLQLWSTSSTSFVARSLDVTIDTGDQVIFQHVRSGDGNGIWRNLRASSTTKNLAVV
jgi:hypothetical protein